MSIETVINTHAERIVCQDVHACLSSLVSTLASGAYALGSDQSELAILAEQAFALACPVDDYESAAYEAGWRIAKDDDRGTVRRPMTDEEREEMDEPEGGMIAAAGSFEACDMDGIDPHVSEVFEHWSVSNWLAEKLAKHGERVDRDFAGMNVWARTTTGQSMTMDAVIRNIAREVATA